MIQCQEVIGNGLSRAQFGNRDLKAGRIVILKAHFPALSGKRNGPGEKRLVHGAASVCLARHIVMQTGLFLMVFGQFIDKGLVSSVGAEPLCSADKNMSFQCCTLPLPVVPAFFR